MPTLSSDNGTLIGSKEAAAILGVNQATVNRWAVSGLVPVAMTAPGKLGANIFTRAAIEAHAAQRRVRPPPKEHP